jgi:hypothetical protein
VGTKKKKREMKSASINIRGLRIRDGGLGGSKAGRCVPLKHPVASCPLAVLIDRGQMRVFVEDPLELRERNRILHRLAHTTLFGAATTGTLFGEDTVMRMGRIVPCWR